MADRKFSELVSASDILAADILPIVTGGVNKKISAGVMSLNMPNLGNKGISKNVPVTALLVDVQLTSTLVQLNLANHTLGAGTEGQEIVLVGTGTHTLTLTGAGTLSSITFPTVGSTVTLVYLGAAWYVKSHFSVTFG